MFVECFGMCMMGWWLVFVGGKIEKNLVIVTGRIWYTIGFAIWCMACISFGLGACGLVILLSWKLSVSLLLVIFGCLMIILVDVG